MRKFEIEAEVGSHWKRTLTVDISESEIKRIIKENPEVFAPEKEKGYVQFKEDCQLYSKYGKGFTFPRGSVFQFKDNTLFGLHNTEYTIEPEDWKLLKKIKVEPLE